MVADVDCTVVEACQKLGWGGNRRGRFSVCNCVIFRIKVRNSRSIIGQTSLFAHIIQRSCRHDDTRQLDDGGRAAKMWSDGILCQLEQCFLNVEAAAIISLWALATRALSQHSSRCNVIRKAMQFDQHDSWLSWARYILCLRRLF